MKLKKIHFLVLYILYIIPLADVYSMYIEENEETAHGKGIVFLYIILSGIFFFIISMLKIKPMYKWTMAAFLLASDAMALYYLFA